MKRWLRWKYSSLLVLSLIVCSLFCFAKVIFVRCLGQRQGSELKHDSMISIIAKPRWHDGKKIKVVGYVVLDESNEAVFLHEADYLNYMPENAIWLRIPNDNLPKYLIANHQYAIVSGIYRYSDCGAFGLFGGAIEVDNMYLHFEASKVQGKADGSGGPRN